jgi:hypothetical protein
MVECLGLYCTLKLGPTNMLNPDFSDRTYTVEVLRTKTDGTLAFNSIIKLIIDPRTINEVAELTGSTVLICHGWLGSEIAYHRLTRPVTLADGTSHLIPRQKRVRGMELNLYDVLVAQCGQHIVVAVPFHDLAEEFFPRVDNRLGGTGTLYEKLDITAMVVRLGASGLAKLQNRSDGKITALSVTRCHLSYVDQQGQKANIQQIRLIGGNLGASNEYKSLIAPVLNPRASALTVTPVVIGFALLADGVRKSSATTDRHGNFKLWIAPGLRRLIRLFELLASLEDLKDVMGTTTNIPIRQSKTIKDVED